MFCILIFTLNSKWCSNFLYVEVYCTLLWSSNSCYKVAWQRSSSHGVHNILLLTFCVSYRLIPSFRLFSGFCFLLVKFTSDVDCCFICTSCYCHTKWLQTFFKRLFTWEPDDGSLVDWNMQLCSNKSEQLCYMWSLCTYFVPECSFVYTAENFT
jgi:hypothetical protein